MTHPTDNDSKHSGRGDHSPTRPPCVLVVHPCTANDAQATELTRADNVRATANFTTVRRVGRPRSLSREELERVLSLSKAGLGSRSITRELQKAGVDVSRPTIQRALAKRGVYAE